LQADRHKSKSRSGTPKINIESSAGVETFAGCDRTARRPAQEYHNLNVRKMNEL
jgi:hypothetical protein